MTTQPVSSLQRARIRYQPKLPKALRTNRIGIERGSPTQSAGDQAAIQELFPRTYGRPLVTLVESDEGLEADPLTVGVVLSGGPAPGGHNVIAGLFDALKAANPASRLLGFLGGPGGVIRGEYRELTPELIDPYRNTGGFDLIKTGRDKIETPDQLEQCRKHFAELGLSGLVVVGGDDSNTNAAVLAEDLERHGVAMSVIGVPKTIDGDMRNEFIEASFGFDTAAKTYAELVGNLCRDAASAVKYWYFVRLMGRSASHLTLECALQTHPNVCLVSEEIEAGNTSLQDLVDQLVGVVVERAEQGRHYGVVLVPEGLIEFIPEFRRLIGELSALLNEEEEYIMGLPDHSERFQYLMSKLSNQSAKVYGFIPQSTQEALLRRDSHGNLPVSQIATEELLMDLVSDALRALNARRVQTGESKIPFSCQGHFFGYEGRSAFPTNFDADYTYSLGYAAAQLIRAHLSGYTVSIRNLTKSAEEWVAGGVPVTMMLNMEERKGKKKPVIRKALVDLDGKPFQTFLAHRDDWVLTDSYRYPGAIQYWGPPEICDAPTLTLVLEQGD